MDIETSSFNWTSLNEIDNLDFIFENEIFSNSLIESNFTNNLAKPASDLDLEVFLNTFEDQNSNSASNSSSITQTQQTQNYMINNNSNTTVNYDELISEMLLNEFNSISPATSNVASSPIYDYSPASNNSSNESDMTNSVNNYQSDSSTTIVLQCTKKAKSSNEIILNINDIGMECLKNQMKSNSKESCIELEETEYESDEDVVINKKLELTEEEKTLFKKEGYEVPRHYPLTKNEEKILKLIRRKIRNKQSAHLSRERKKCYVDGLEKRVDKCTKENQLLHKQIKQLKDQNNELVTKLQKMQTCLISILSKSNKAKLSTTILFLSFFMTFCVYPLFDSKQPASTNSIQVVPFIGGNSRTLMSTTDDNSIYLPNEIKNGFVENTSNNPWNPYRYRYDI